LLKKDFEVKKGDEEVSLSNAFKEAQEKTNVKINISDLFK
jgi:hypothetical protein